MFKRQLQTYANASRLQREDDPTYRSEKMLLTFLTLSNSIDSAADSNDLDKDMGKFEEYFMGVVYDSYRFHLGRQAPLESIEAYIAELRKLAKTCNCGPMEDRLIRDQVVVGIRKDML